jgi:ATP-binding cassette, subfamily B, bacterial
VTRTPRVTVRRALQVLRLSWQTSPGTMVVIVALAVLDGATPVAAAWATKILIDQIGRGHDASVSTVVGCGVLLASAGIVDSMSQAVGVYVHGRLRRRVRTVVQVRLLDRLNAYPGLAAFEDPDLLDRIRLAEHAGDSAPEDILGGSIFLLRASVTAAGFVTSLLVIWPPILLLVVAAAIPAAMLQVRLGRLRAETLRSISVLQRRQIFYRGLATDVRAAKEIRVFGLSAFLGGRMRRDLASSNAAEDGIDRRSATVEGLLGLMAAVVTVGGVAVAATLGVRGTLSPGDVIVFLAAIAALHSMITSATEQAARAYESLIMFGYFQDIVEDAPPEQPGLPVPALSQGIEFHDVWFRYADGLPWVLKGVSLRLPAYTSMGLVGVNGAGKSTIVKLVCRLYEPQRGRITWDGTDLAVLDAAALRRRVSAVFQDFMAYDLTAAENIGLGRADDRARIRAAASLAGVDETLASLPRGYDTMLSRIFPDDEDGRTLTLSGGQWQRIAVARAFLRDDADVLILDEPSAGLDAQAESHLHQRLAALRPGRLSLLISHRLNTMRDADRILVIDEGRVVESGCHDELMAAGGRYAQLFQLQSEGYQASAGQEAG